MIYLPDFLSYTIGEPLQYLMLLLLGFVTLLNLRRVVVAARNR
jgi:hypothetical protein